MKRVLVTGATGCIGRPVCQLLERAGWHVHAMTGRGVSPIDGIESHRVDLFDSAATRDVVKGVGATHLLHLAWSIPPGRWADSAENVRWVGASLNLLDAFLEAGGQRCVTAGSCLEYDWRYGYCSEAVTPTNPHTLYGASKHALQVVTCGLAATRSATSAWARIFFLYGPGEHPDRLIASVIRSLLAGTPARCSHGQQIRDYLYVRDVASALVRLLESDVSGPINIGSGRPVTLRALVTRVGELLDRVDLLQFGAISAASTDVPLVVADTSRLAQLGDWSPEYDVDRGLLETIEWWRERPGTPASGGRS